MKMKYYNGKALDLTQTVYMNQYAPIVYCCIKFSASIDLARLKSAVSRTVVIVPQILCRYDYKKTCGVRQLMIRIRLSKFLPEMTTSTILFGI